MTAESRKPQLSHSGFTSDLLASLSGLDHGHSQVLHHFVHKFFQCSSQLKNRNSNIACHVLSSGIIDMSWFIGLESMIPFESVEECREIHIQMLYIEGVDWNYLIPSHASKFHILYFHIFPMVRGHGSRSFWDVASSNFRYWLGSLAMENGPSTNDFTYLPTKTVMIHSKLLNYQRIFMLWSATCHQPEHGTPRHTAPAASALFAVDHGRWVPAPKQSAGSCWSGGSRLPGGWGKWTPPSLPRLPCFCSVVLERSLKLR